MPTKRTKRGRAARIRITPEVLRAIRAEQDGTRDPHAHSPRHLLGIRPWEWGCGPLSIAEDAHPELCAELDELGVPREETDAD